MSYEAAALIGVAVILLSMGGGLLAGVAVNLVSETRMARDVEKAMTKEEVITHLCETVSLVYHTQGDYRRPSDGFCAKCAARQTSEWTFEHAGKTLEYVREAVLRALKQDGYMGDKKK